MEETSGDVGVKVEVEEELKYPEWIKWDQLYNGFRAVLLGTETKVLTTGFKIKRYEDRHGMKYYRIQDRSFKVEVFRDPSDYVKFVYGSSISKSIPLNSEGKDIYMTNGKKVDDKDFVTSEETISFDRSLRTLVAMLAGIYNNHFHYTDKYYLNFEKTLNWKGDQYAEPFCLIPIPIGVSTRNMLDFVNNKVEEGDQVVEIGNKEQD